MSLTQLRPRPAPSSGQPTMPTRWARFYGYAGTCLSVAAMAAGLWVGGRDVHDACAAHEAAAYGPDCRPQRWSAQAGDQVGVVLSDGLNVDGSIVVADEAVLELKAGHEFRAGRAPVDSIAAIEEAGEVRAEFGETAMRIVTVALLVAVYASIVAFQFLS